MKKAQEDARHSLCMYSQLVHIHLYLQIRGKIYCTPGQQTPKSALGRRTASVNDDIRWGIMTIRGDHEN